jgi:hypothetical protein
VHLFLQSLTRHFGWWIAALWTGRHKGAPLGRRRLLFLFLFYPAFVGLQLLHWLGMLCDEILFPCYRKIRIEAPVFVLGIPRSGTTFLHRTLAEDRTRFTSFSTWEALLAPSVTERKILGLVRSADRLLGSPLSKLIKTGLRAASGDFDSIHSVGLKAPEEDYLSLLPAGGCLILLLAFPFSPRLRQLSRLDAMPAGERERLLHFYKRALQRHLYCHAGKRLLSKNAAFASWADALLGVFPDATVLVCVREPVSALSSQLSSLAPARTIFGTDPDGSHTARLFTEIYAHSYRSLARFVQSRDPREVAVIEQSDMKAMPAETIRDATVRLGLDYDGQLEALRPAKPSAHDHAPGDFSLDQQEIKRCMTPHYEAMLQCQNRISKRSFQK